MIIYLLFLILSFNICSVLAGHSSGGFEDLLNANENINRKYEAGDTCFRSEYELEIPTVHLAHLRDYFTPLQKNDYCIPRSWEKFCQQVEALSYLQTGNKRCNSPLLSERLRSPFFRKNAKKDLEYIFNKIKSDSSFYQL